MKYILWIDDEPLRSKVLGLNTDQDVLIVFAHGYDEIYYALNLMGIKWDLVILDHDMPRMNGQSVVRTFLAERNIPVVLCSTNYDGRMAQAALLSEYAVSYFDIPITDPCFRCKLSEIIFPREV